MADAAAPLAAEQPATQAAQPAGAAEGARAAPAAGTTAAAAGEPSGSAHEEQRKRELEEGETIAIKVTFGERWKRQS